MILIIVINKPKSTIKNVNEWITPQSGIGATICQAQTQEGPGLTPAQVKTSIHQKKMTTHEKFILSKTIGIHYALLKSKSIDDHLLECARVKKEIKK